MKVTSGSTQDFGKVAPSSGIFTSIKQISPTGLGWPLGDIGSESDPINGWFYTQQGDVLAINKSSGDTNYLGVGSNASIIGYDTINNNLIYREVSGSTNALRSLDINGTPYTSHIGNYAGSDVTWQAAGIGAVNSFAREAYQLKTSTNKLHIINIDNGSENIVTLPGTFVTITFDSKQSKLYGIYDSDGSSGYRIAEINTNDGTVTNITSANSISQLSNYVQFVSPNDQRFYYQNGSKIKVVSLSDGSDLGEFTAPLRILPPGAIVLGNASTEQSIDYDISENGSKIIKKGDNTVIYTGSNSSSAGVDIEAGTLKVASSDKLGSGSVSLEGGELEISADTTITNAIASTDDSSAIDTGTNTVTISGTVSGSNKINKTGAGILTLTGTNTNTTGVEIDQGTLVANGAGSMPVIVNSGTLQGSGTIGNLTSSSTIEPGNSIGTLNVSGAVTLNSGSVLVIEVDAAGNSDKIVATGAVTAGGTLRISPGSGAYSSSQQYTIITGSSISGTFNTITVLSCSGSASASYGSTSIIITLSNCFSNLSANRETISSYVNDLSSGASGDLSTVITALNTLSGDNYNNALEALDYNSSSAISSVVQSQVASINNVIGQRVAASTIGNNKVVSLVGFLNSSSSIDQSNTLSFEDKLKQMGMTGWWTQVHGGTGDKKSLKDIGVNGYDFNHFGTTVGFDQQTDKGTDGLALTFQRGTIDSDNNEGSTDHKTFAVSKYQSTNIEDGKRRTLSGSFGITNIDSSRTLNFASINRTATASYNSYSLNGTAEYTYPEKNWFGSSHNLSVNGGLTLNYQEGFTETGANALNLKVDANQTQLANAGLVDTIYWSDKTEGETIPFLSLGLHTSYHIGSVESKQRFVNQTNFTTKSDRRSNTHGEIGLGFIQSKDSNTELSFLAKSNFSDKLSENTATFKYSVKF